MNRGDEPAYPMLQPRGDFSMSRESSGMTIREAFAKAAMQGFLAQDTDGELERGDITCWAVEHADALLAELAKET